MKVIAVDNLDWEHVSDILVAEGLSLYEAERMVKEKNNSDDGDKFFRAVDDKYKLYVYDPT